MRRRSSRVAPTPMETTPAMGVQRPADLRAAQEECMLAGVQSSGKQLQRTRQPQRCTALQGPEMKCTAAAAECSRAAAVNACRVWSCTLVARSYRTLILCSEVTGLQTHPGYVGVPQSLKRF